MTIRITFILFILFISWLPSAFAKDLTFGRVEISFDYNRADRDYANNQFSVWIEDVDGNLVKTLFVTQFTAQRGWKIRKETLPTWKKKVKISSLSKDEVDAISGATPKAQRLVFTWQEKNAGSSFLPSGDYRYFVECNYFWDDTVLYSGRFRVGERRDINKAVAKFSSENAEQYNIVENVSAEFIPLQ